MSLTAATAGITLNRAVCIAPPWPFKRTASQYGIGSTSMNSAKVVVAASHNWINLSIVSLLCTMV